MGLKNFLSHACLFLVFTSLSYAFADETSATAKIAVPARGRVQLESAALWQTRNTFRLPTGSGSEIDLSDFQSGPFFSARISAEWNINENHGLRALYAPLSISIPYTPAQAVSIAGKTFAAGTPLTTQYTFNSYRLTYRYMFDPVSDFHFRLGVTAKIRQANVFTSDGTTISEDSNVGFVPLLHFGVRWVIDDNWFGDFDADALVAPQGRAEDLALRFGYVVNPWEVALGYRVLEGGADGSSVYTFAFFHYAFASVAYAF